MRLLRAGGHRSSWLARPGVLGFLAGAALLLYGATVLDSAGLRLDVFFPDPNLEAAVRTQLVPPIPAIQPVTDVEMLTLTSLSADGLAIADLGGLQFATNLTTLSLGDNQITDISPIAGLGNLTDLNLSINQISDVRDSGSGAACPTWTSTRT